MILSITILLIDFLMQENVWIIKLVSKKFINNIFKTITFSPWNQKKHFVDRNNFSDFRNYSKSKQSHPTNDHLSRQLSKRKTRKIYSQRTHSSKKSEKRWNPIFYRRMKVRILYNAISVTIGTGNPSR